MQKSLARRLLMISAVVVVALLARVEDKAEQVGLYEGFDIARAATNDSDIILLQHVFRTLAHIARKHNLYAHISQYGGNTRLASATLGRRQTLARNNLALLDGKNRIVVAMAKVVVNATIACRNSYFHNI